jgi:hypothetical protein
MPSKMPSKKYLHSLVARLPHAAVTALRARREECGERRMALGSVL